MRRLPLFRARGMACAQGLPRGGEPLTFAAAYAKCLVGKGLGATVQGFSTSLSTVFVDRPWLLESAPSWPVLLRIAAAYGKHLAGQALDAPVQGFSTPLSTPFVDKGAGVALLASMRGMAETVDRCRLVVTNIPKPLILMERVSHSGVYV